MSFRVLRTQSEISNVDLDGDVNFGARSAPKQNMKSKEISPNFNLGDPDICLLECMSVVAAKDTGRPERFRFVVEYH